MTGAGGYPAHQVDRIYPDRHLLATKLTHRLSVDPTNRVHLVTLPLSSVYCRQDEELSIVFGRVFGRGGGHNA